MLGFCFKKTRPLLFVPLFILTLGGIAAAQPAAPVATVATSVTDSAFTANWNTVTGIGTISYRLDVATEPLFNFLLPLYNNLTVLGTSQVVTGLLAGTQYFYRVRAVDSTGVSPNSNTISPFTLPSAPVLGTDTLVTSTGFTLRWGGVTGATGYQLDVSLLSGFGSFVPGDSSLSVAGTSQAVSGLSPNITYYFRVRAVDSSGAGPNSATGSQLTAPAAPVANAAGSVTSTGFSASWSAAAGAVGYAIDVSTDILFGSFITGYNNRSLGNLTITPVTGLTAATQYFYRVRASDSAGTSPNSNTIGVTTLPNPPPAPTALPATFVTVAGFTANWTSSAGATVYALDVATNNTFSAFVSGYDSLPVASTSQPVTGLSAGTNYYYRVRAVNPGGASAFSDTVPVVTLPPAPVAGPASNISNAGFTAHWAPATGATDYRIDLSTDTLFGSFVSPYNGYSVGNVTSFAFGSLSPSTKYFYRVRGFDAGGVGPNSQTVVVTTYGILIITTPSPLPGGTAGVAYSTPLAATGGLVPYTWSLVSGTLPPNFSLTAAGVLSGNSTAAGLYSFTVQVNSSASDSTTKSFSLTIAPAAPVGLAFTTQPSSAAAASTINPPVQVSVQDAFGNTVTSDGRSVTVAIGTNPGGGTLTGVLTANAISGVASFPGLSINKTGTGYTLVASSVPSLPGATSNPFNITPGTPFRLTFGQEPAIETAGAVITPAVTVRIEDNNGNLVTGDTRSVTISIGTNPTGGTLSGTLTVNAVGGLATFSNLSINRAGNGYTLTASSNPVLPPSITTDPFNVVPASASKIAIFTQPSALDTAGKVFSVQPVIYIEDSNGNIVTSDSSTVTASRNAGTGALQGTTSVRAFNGVATFSNLSYNVAEGITISFSRAGAASVTSAPVTVVPAAPAQVLFVGQPPLAVTAGAVMGPPIKTQLQDAFGNNVSSTSLGTVTLQLVGTGTLLGTNPQSVNGAGLATFNDLSVRVAGSKRLAAVSSLGLTPDTSAAFTVLPDQASRLAILTQPSSVVIAGVPFPQQPALQIQDQFGNLRPDYAVAVTALKGKGAGSLGGITSASPAAGVATFANLSYSGADTTDIIFNSGSLTPATSADIIASPGALFAFAVEAALGGPIGQQTAGVPVNIRITAKDSTGNTVTSFTGKVNITSTGTLGSGGGLSNSFSNGVLSTQVVVLNTGTFTVTATNNVPVYQSGTSAPFVVVAGPLNTFLVEAAGGGPIGTQMAGIPFSIRVTARDANNNALTSFAGPVTLTSAAGGLAGSPLTSGTFVNGVLASQSITLRTAGTGITITALSGTIVSSSAPFTVIHNNASQVRVETEADGTGTLLVKQNISSGTSITVFAVRRDSLNNFIDNAAADSWMLQLIAGGVAPTDLVASGDRKSATFTGRLIGKAMIDVALTGLTPVNSDTLTVVVAGSAARLLVETEANGTGSVVAAQTIVSGKSLAVYAVARDAVGNFVRNAPAAWSLKNVTGGILPGDLGVAPDGKSATLTGRLSGSAQIEADSLGLPSSPSGLIAVTPGAMAFISALEVSTPESTTVNTVFPRGLQAMVKDSAGNGVPGVTVTFSSPSNGPGGTFSITGGSSLGAPGKGRTVVRTPSRSADGSPSGTSSSSVTDSTGVARAVFRANTIAGSYSDTASVAGLPLAALFALTNLAGAPVSIAADTASATQSTQINTAFPHPFTVSVADSFQNPVPGVRVTFTLVEGSSGQSGRFLSGTTTTQAVTNSSGVAVAESFIAGLKAESYTVNATVPGVASPAVFRLTNRSGPVSTVSVASGSGQSRQVATPFLRLAVSVLDAANNPVAGLPVRFVAPSSGATARFNLTKSIDSVLTDASGIARSDTIVADTVAGSFTVSAFAAGIPTPAVFSLAALPAPVNNFLVEAQGGGPIAAEIAQTPFAVRITSRDRYGNVASGFSDSVNITSTGTLTQGGGLSGGFTGGVLPALAVAIRSAGNWSLTATRKGGLETGTSNTFAVNNPVPVFTGIAPVAGVLGQSLDIQIKGSGFIAGVTSVSFGNNVTIVKSNVVSFTTLSATLRIDTSAAEGPRTFSIINAPPGGGVITVTNAFSIGSNPPPLIASVTPAQASRLQTLTILILGSNFTAGATSADFGGGVLINSTTIDSARLMTVSVSVSPGAATGPRNVVVRTAPPGGGSDTLTGGFTIVNPAPVLSSIAPSGANRLQRLDVAFTGTNFISGTTAVSFADTAVTVNSVAVVSATQLTANITVGASASTGQHRVTVSNPAPGGGRSDSLAFTVTVPPPVAPSLLLPVNGAGNLYTRQQLIWNRPAGATSYRVQLALSPAFASPAVIVDSTLADTTCIVSGLRNDTTYYWRAEAGNAGGTSAFSASYNFRTGASYPLSFAVLDTLLFPVKASPGDFTPTDYRIFGLPGASRKPLGAILGGTFNTDWTASWDNGAALVGYDGGPDFTFAPGRAFWILHRGPVTVRDTVPSLPLDSTGSVKIPLHAGWNLIADPLPVPVSWSFIQFLNGGITDSLFMFTGGFSISSKLAPSTGYYFFNAKTLDSLTVPFSGLASTASFSKPAALGTWRVRLALKSERALDESLILGVSPAAPRGMGQADYRKPRSPEGVPSVYFSRPEWDPKYSTFGGDIRPEFSEVEKWTFEVSCRERKPLELRFSGIESVPKEFQVVVIDVNRAHASDLRATASYAFTAVTDVSEFTVVVGTPEAVKKEIDAILPKEFALGVNYPNPFNPSTTIPVTLPLATEVTLKIYNILGEEVRTLFAGPLNGGRFYFTWDGRSNAGNSVATGVYIVRLSTGAGKHFTGKMLLLK